jgi:hypothetical protein
VSSALILLGLLGLLVALVGVVKGGVRSVGLADRRSSQLAGLAAFAVVSTGTALAAPTGPAGTDGAEAGRAVPPVASAPAAGAVASGAAAPGAAAPSRAALPSPSAAPAAQSLTEAEPHTALALLGTLPVKGRAPRTGYDRELFGPAWADTDRNGCDTRNDVLQRDLTGETLREGTHGCVVVSGTLAEPYTGRTMAFRKSDAGAVHIDHVVALSDAWQTGAQAWSAGKRLAFANDPLNLLAVDGAANQAKSDSDAASWLPPNKAYRCPMVARQVAVKAKYGLWVKPAERDAIARVLDGCPGLAAPTGGTPTEAPVAPAPRRTAATQPAATQQPATAPPATAPPATATRGGTDPRFGTCKEAKRNGYGPYTRGEDPEYDWYRDGDGDGVVCE